MEELDRYIDTLQGMIIPGEVLKHTNADSLLEVYEYLCERDDTDEVMLMQCPVCERFDSMKYYTIGSLPQEYHCPCGHTETDIFSNAIVFFEKKIND